MANYSKASKIVELTVSACSETLVSISVIVDCIWRVSNEGSCIEGVTVVGDATSMFDSAWVYLVASGSKVSEVTTCGEDNSTFNVDITVWWRIEGTVTDSETLR